MKAADAAGLMAARAGHVVEPPLKAGRPSGCFASSRRFRGLLQRGDDVAFAEYGIGRAPSPCTRPNAGCRSEASKSDRRRRDRGGGQKFLRDQNRAAIEFAEMPGIEQPRLEVAPEIFVRQNPLAIDLVLDRRFLERLRLRVVVETPSTDSRCGNRGSPISAHARSADWFRCGRCFRARSDPAGRPSPSSFAASSAPVSDKSPAAASGGRSRRR